MIQYVQNIEYNSTIAIVTYWLPLLICLVGYTCKTWKEYRTELKSSAECLERNIGYYPKLTLGVIVARIFASVLPIFNIIAIAFDIGWPMVTGFVKSITNVLDIPLVRPHVAKPVRK